MAQIGQAQTAQLAEVPTREQIQQVACLKQLAYCHALVFRIIGECTLVSQDLEDNEKLIKAILENMNAGKLQACAGYALVGWLLYTASKS